jgi:predicted metal-dependent hydrolase
MRFALKRGPERLVVEIAGRDVAVAVVRHRRARRLILRIDDTTGLPAVTLPVRTSLAEGERFLRANAAWLTAQLARRAPQVPFRDGGEFPLRGRPCRIVHRGGRGLVALEQDGEALMLNIPGAAEFLPRRVVSWLKREARRDIARAVAHYTAALGRKPAGIRIGDAKSRWGSCSAHGVLTFSWRLVLAPPDVLAYLAAHEVAHLAAMNHGREFWALVERIHPDYRPARAWLRANGTQLHAIGRSV